MKPLTSEWVAKAENDYASACREYRARKHPNHDLTCFLSQQCAEKYLKARLQEAGADVEKTHNLVHLLDRCLAWEPLWEAHRSALALLGNYAIAFRYPGENADKATAKEALLLARRIRSAARAALGLRG